MGTPPKKKITWDADADETLLMVMVTLSCANGQIGEAHPKVSWTRVTERMNALGYKATKDSFNQRYLKFLLPRFTSAMEAAGISNNSGAQRAGTVSDALAADDASITPVASPHAGMALTPANAIPAMTAEAAATQLGAIRASTPQALALQATDTASMQYMRQIGDQSAYAYVPGDASNGRRVRQANTVPSGRTPIVRRGQGRERRSVPSRGGLSLGHAPVAPMGIEQSGYVATPAAFDNFNQSGYTDVAGPATFDNFDQYDDVIDPALFCVPGSSYGAIQNPYGSTQHPYGSIQAPYGSIQASYGATQASYGATQAPYGAIQAPYGAVQAFGPATPNVTRPATPNAAGLTTRNITGRTTPDVSGFTTPNFPGRTTPDVAGVTHRNLDPRNLAMVPAAPRNGASPTTRNSIGPGIRDVTDPTVPQITGPAVTNATGPAVPDVTGPTTSDGAKPDGTEPGSPDAADPVAASQAHED